MIDINYNDFLLNMLRDNEVNENQALDFGCGPELRHSQLLTHYFKLVHAIDKKNKKTAIENTFYDRSKIKVFYDDLVFTESYDLMGFFWPEVPYYSFFIETVLANKKLLKPHGKIMFVFREYQSNTSELDFTSIYFKYLIVNHEQKMVINEKVISEIEKHGIHLIDQRYYFNDDSFVVPDITQEILSNKNIYISDDEKKRFVEYVKNGMKGKTGNSRFLLFE